jgi:5'-phosphate synthase pdxT subunit
VELRPKQVGILSIQGDIEAHAKAVEGLGAEPRAVLRDKDLDGLSALILPGGESTTIAKGLERLRLHGPIRAFAEAGHPVLGTCAGGILLARASRNHPVETLGLIDMLADRNAYGTQVDSFAVEADPPAPGQGAGPSGSQAGGPAGELAGMRCVFIRAPRFVELGPGVDALLRVDGAPVLVRQGAILACSFHPELTGDPRVHALLLSLARPEPD